MTKTYEYYTTLNGQDIIIHLDVISFTSQKALGRKADSDADCYGYTSIEWRTNDDINFMEETEVQAMEEWLSIEHEEWLKDMQL